MPIVASLGLPRYQFFDNAGKPLVAGKLYTYLAGSNTLAPTYRDAGGGIPNTNPILLDLRGETALWFDVSKAYKIILQTTNGTTLRTDDNIRAPASDANVAQVVALGGQITTFQAGLASLTTDVANFVAGGVGDITIRPDLASSDQAKGAALVSFTHEGIGAVTRSVQDEIRDLPVSVKRFGAVGDGVADDTAAIQAAASSIGLNGGTLFFPSGTYKWTTAISLPGGVSIAGEGYASILKPTACSGFLIADNGTIGGVSYRDFYMLGSSLAAYTAIEFMPGNAILVGPRVQGATIERIIIDSFLNGIVAKNLWHSTFRGCVLNRCKNGIQFLGQCVSIDVSGCKISRGVAPSSDGSVGILIAGSTEYSDAVFRRPEAVKISNETLVYGYDTNVYVNSCLSFAIAGCDIDYSVNYGIRVVSVDGGCDINGNWIAGDNAAGGVPKLIAIDNLGTLNGSPINIERNNLSFTGTTVATGSYGIRIGSNRVGLRVIKGNNVDGPGIPGVQYGVYLDNTGPGVIVEDNYIGGHALSIFTNTCAGHTIRKNKLDGNIQRTPGSMDYFDVNAGGFVPFFRGPVTIPAANTVTGISLASLGVATPITGSPSYLNVRIDGYQFSGTIDRGIVRAYYDGAGSIVINTPNPVGADASDIWVDLNCY